MGVSTNAVIAFGFDLGEELPEALQTAASDDDDEGYCGYFSNDDFVLRQVGLKEPEDASYAGPEWDAYRKARDKAIADFPVEIVTHCSGSCPMYFVSVNGTSQSARRGYPQEIKRVDISDEQIALLKSFCERFGIEWQEPSWQLFSYWDE